MSNLLSVVPHFWSPLVAHPWSSVATPGLVAGLVTAFLQRKPADLQMIKINETKHVADWLARAETDKDPKAIESKTHWQPRDIVLLTNYGKGTAYDIRLSGSDCRPRVFVRDTAGRKLEDEGDAAEPVDALPMWSNRYPALEPGKEWSLVVMSSTDDSRDPPVLEVSWRGLELSWRRLIRRRKTRRFDLANANMIETGWPGKTKMETDAD